LIVYFADTSALAKRYLAEVGSRWMRNQLIPSSGNVILISQTASIEIFSLLARRQREKSISPSAEMRLRRAFLRHLMHEYLAVPLDNHVLIQARNLTTKYPLRTLDAIQLGSAVMAKTYLSEPIIFVGSDNNLLAAVSSEGFAVDNPLNHP
jgi:uncharacterized protein